MGRKKVYLLLLSLVLLLALFANSSFASRHPDSNSLGGAFDSIRQLFDFLPKMLTMKALLDGDPIAVFWAKFLIWLGLFAVLYFGASFVFRQNTSVAVIVAIVFSLIGALMIPTDIVAAMFQTYGFVAALIVWLAPVLAGFWIAHQVQHRIIRAIIYGIALAILTAINVGIASDDFPSISFAYFGLIWAVTLILFIVNLFAGFGELRGGQPADGGGGGGGGNPLENFLHGAGAGARDVAGDFRRRGQPPGGPQVAQVQALAGQAAEREQQIQQEQENLRRIRQRLENELQMTRGNELQDLQIISQLLNELLQIEERLRNMQRFP